MFWRSAKPSPRDDPHALRLRPSPGYGDHLMLSAVLEGVKAERPEIRFFLAASHPELFHHNPQVEEVVAVRRLEKRDPARLAGYLPVRSRQPAERYMQVSGHLIDDMYGRLGLSLASRPRRPRIYLTGKEERFRERFLESLRPPRIAVVPHGARHVRLPNKVYPADQWAELARLLTGTPGTVIHLGTRKDGPLVPGAVDLRDIGYRNTASVLGRCTLLVTHVSGIMHLAAAVGTPAVVLYGAAEHPAVSGYPWNRNLYTPIECGPCWMEEPCSHHSCMRGLTPARVLAEIELALAGQPAISDRSR